MRVEDGTTKNKSQTTLEMVFDSAKQNPRQKSDHGQQIQKSDFFEPLKHPSDYSVTENHEIDKLKKIYLESYSEIVASEGQSNVSNYKIFERMVRKFQDNLRRQLLEFSTKQEKITD